MTTSLPPDLHQSLCAFLGAALPARTEERARLLRLALDEAAPGLYRRLDLEGDAESVARGCILTLLDVGCLTSGEHPLVLLLQTIAEREGPDTQRRVNRLIDQVEARFQRELEEAYLTRRREALAAEEARLAQAYTPLAGQGEVQRPRVEIRPCIALLPPEIERLGEPVGAAARERRAFEDIIAGMAEIRHAVLLGEPGAGKSTTLRKLEQEQLAVALQDATAPLPLYVPLGEWTEAGESLEAFMAARLGTLGRRLGALLTEGRVSLLLDGLNEIPVAQRAAKAQQVAALFRRRPKPALAVVSCRAQDYTLDLGVDRLLITPLDPARIREFARRALGEATGEHFFWQLAGGEAVRALQEKWARVGASFDLFWNAPEVPRENPNVYDATTSAEDILWQERVRQGSGSLLELACNPYLLVMLVALYAREQGRLPENRGELFERFTETLLLRESERREPLALLATRELLTHQVTISAAGAALLEALERLAYEMQVRRAQDGAEASAVTVLDEAEVVPALLSEQQLYQGRSTNLLALGEVVRFSHQLLQEYFAARYMKDEMAAGRLQASALWPPERWWERTNWEEATVLLAGLYSDDCTRVLRWVAEANPEVAAQCMVRSGARTPEETRDWLRDLWLPRLTDLERDPDPRARAAVGRALGLTDLDNRPGVGLRADGLPDIAWVEIPGGPCRIGGDEGAYSSLPAQEIEIPSFWLAKYPITYRQFQAFVEAEDGHENVAWWAGLERQEPAEQDFKFWNHPRENVSWYEAMAFCRWLSAQLGYEVRLPGEEEWEKAARGVEGRIYPWGNEYISGYANIDETGRFGDKVGPYYLQQTSAVGVYPQGASPYGVEEMSGNVWEWCLTNVSDPLRVLRGGSWRVNAQYARAASRLRNLPHFRFGVRGFRVACSLPAVSDI